MSNDRLIIKLRGLPWNSSAKDVIDFLKNVEVVDGEKGVHMAISPRDGRPNGKDVIFFYSNNANLFIICS
jgi:RNA recognition motif-containing protein